MPVGSGPRGWRRSPFFSLLRSPIPANTRESEFRYRGGELHAEDIPLARIAEAVGTPFYCYSAAMLEASYRRFAAAFGGQRATICYALKANSNQAVLRLFARLGAGADVVSEGELRRALAAGIPPGRIVFAGVAKTRDEMAFALDSQIHQFNVESEPELVALEAVARGKGLRAPVAIRINPDVDARTHAKISTGKSENKFGIDLAHALPALRRAAAMPGIDLKGVAVHIGSQLTELEPFRVAFGRLVELVRQLRAEGIDISRVDLGGGIGVRYHAESPPDIADYAAMVKALTGNLGVELAFEPGRQLVAEAGILVSRVVYLKEGATRRFVIQDAAMNDLIRPALYEAWHDIVPVTEPPLGAPQHPVDVVGPVCESGDTFATQRSMPPVEEGDLLATLSAGAYGAVMASTYNSRLLVPEVLVSGSEYFVIRRRSSYNELLALDQVPEWLRDK
jgi:diaminopimelate decarboxylase